MSRSSQLRVSRTRNIPVPNEYISALLGDLSAWSFDEERAPGFKGRWRELAFGETAGGDVPMDLEIGTGNGLHFAHHALKNPQRRLIGLELRYKPLIQSIRRALRGGAVNARIARYNAYLLPELFTPGELDDVFIFFPDPWEKQRNHKHRLIQDAFLESILRMQKPGSRLFFKTDSLDYFEWSLKRFQRGPYAVTGHTYDLHQSEFAAGNFITQFENIFLRQGLKIGYAQLLRE
jgi:tRNA (guanine-N7-)-methyltransferase